MADANRLARTLIRLQSRLMVRFRRDMQRELRARYRAAAAGMRKGGVIEAENAMAGHADEIEKIVRAHYFRVAEIVGPLTLDGIKGVGAWATKDFEDEQFMQLLTDWLATQGAQQVSGQISSTTRTQIREIVQQGLLDGIGTAAIARRLERQLGSVMSAVRSHVIARTETHNALSFASDAAARTAGVPGILREWVAVNDARTRTSHDPDEGGPKPGELVGMDDPFTFTRMDGRMAGTQYVLMRPGDPNGPVDGIVMCRCVVAFHPPEI